MTPEEFAALLNGRQYTQEITKAECELAKANNLVVVFGASDDLLEFCGAIEDEIGAYEGAEVFIYKSRLMDSEESLSDRRVFEKYGIPFQAFKIESIWCPDNLKTSWLISSDIPGAYPFDIFEDDELYCRGLVFKFLDE